MVLAHYSWSDYFLAIGIGLVVYYLVVGVRFYRREAKALMLGGRNNTSDVSAASAPAYSEDAERTVIPQATSEQEEEPFTQEEVPEDSFKDVEMVIADLKVVIGHTQRNKMGKDVLLKLIKEVFAKYPSVNQLAFREAINEFVATECKGKGTVVLKEEEVDELW
ncbi:hypothetical protein [Olivibacter domesticus]|uniref:Uncharacterized protein n=1 Tax=Olivibacter domesticus TaxID=407022 RepID=A0A1H7IA54_OLID1|nr:hypothetical protein [Olivibacter domesticus]SEK59386.1 hypothetical protein SAMN05661044_00635 [Olivibacter domesticus]